MANTTKGNRQVLKFLYLSFKKKKKKKQWLWEETHENRKVRELGDELGDAEATRSRANNVESESEWGENEVYGEVEDVRDLLAIASCEELVFNICELLQVLQHALCSAWHGKEWSEKWELRAERIEFLVLGNVIVVYRPRVGLSGLSLSVVLLSAIYVCHQTQFPNFIISILYNILKRFFFFL